MKNRTNLQSGHLLPICEENAPQFSSAVYNNRYTSAKNASRFRQSGRSMIEMLGVLAIVGVLSVGGIAGYSKAMQKYRTNKTIEQVTQIINGVRTLYSQQKNYDGVNSYYLGPLRKAKILPESAWESTGQYDNPKNPFGGMYYIESKSRSENDSGKAVLLKLFGIPDDACIELATQDWGTGESLYAVRVSSFGDTILEIYKGCSGSSSDGEVIGCVGGDRVSLPIPMDDAISACASNNDNYLGFYFY